MRRELGHVAIREAADGDGLTLEGVAVPWRSAATNTREYGRARETFAPGAFRDAIARREGRPIAFLEDHEGTVIGSVAELAENDEGLVFRGRLLGNQAARDYAERVAAGIDGVSLEFTPGVVRRRSDAVTHTAIGELVAIAGTYAPALAGARVALREDPMQEFEQAEPEAPPSTITAGEVRTMVRGELEELRREIAERRAEAPADPYASIRAYRSLGELMYAVAHEPERLELRDFYARALADQISSESPGVMTPGVVGEVHGILAPSRPGVDAFGREPLGGTGMTVTWPYVTVALSTLVGVQATQKSEILSLDVPILLGSSAIATYAGGSDLALQLINRSSPSYLEAYGRILLAAYAVVTDKAFVDAVEAAATGTLVVNFATASADQIRAAMFAGSTKVQLATGAPATFVLASAEAFTAIGGALNPAGAANGQQGSASAAELSPVISGLRVMFDPNVNTGTALISNGRTAAWHEDGPFQISADDVAKLGRDVAYWGMGATAVYLPAGIVKTSAALTAREGEEESSSKRRG